MPEITRCSPEASHDNPDGAAIGPDTVAAPTSHPAMATRADIHSPSDSATSRGLSADGQACGSERDEASGSIPGSGDTAGVGRHIVLELRVRNHPGTMSHVTGLFARRGFNLDAILCVPLADGATSLMRLLVSDEPRLEQVERQLAKLHDVLEVRQRTDLPVDYFGRLVSS